MKTIPLALSTLLLAGCGQSYLRIPPTDTTPAIVFCTSQAELESHQPQDSLDIMAANSTYADGFYRRSVNTIYLRTESSDTLTPEEALRLMHELLHCADARFHGNAWALLKDMGYNNHPKGKETP